MCALYYSWQFSKNLDIYPGEAQTINEEWTIFGGYCEWYQAQRCKYRTYLQGTTVFIGPLYFWVVRIIRFIEWAAETRVIGEKKAKIHRDEGEVQSSKGQKCQEARAQVGKCKFKKFFNKLEGGWYIESVAVTDVKWIDDNQERLIIDVLNMNFILAGKVWEVQSAPNGASREGQSQGITVKAQRGV